MRCPTLTNVIFCLMCAFTVNANLIKEYGKQLGNAPETKLEIPKDNKQIVQNVSENNVQTVENVSENNVQTIQNDEENNEQNCQHLHKEEEEITEEKYYAAPSKTFKCVDHIKMLEIGYSCMDSESMTPEDVGAYKPDDIHGAINQTIFVVSKNGRKYFMKILDKLYNLELLLLPMFSGDGYSLWLVEYKIIRGRYIGIYSYIGHHSTIKYLLQGNDFSLFNRVYVLRDLAEIASDFYSFVNSQNSLLQLNLWPSNILLTEEGFLRIRLINYLVTTEDKNVVNDFPQYKKSNPIVNQKSITVYLLGKLVFYFIYGRHSKMDNIDEEPEVIELNKSDLTDRNTRVMKYLIQISRGMLQDNPIDRPSIELVQSQFDKALDVLFDPWTKVRCSYCDYMFIVNQEAKNEIDSHEDNLRIKARSNALAKLIKKKSREQKDITYVEQMKAINAKNQEFFDYQGMEENCKIEPTQKIINHLDSFGFVPALISTYEDTDNVAEDVLEKKENGTRGVTNDDTAKMDPRQMRYEFFILIGILSCLVLMVIAYFFLKNLKVTEYEKNFFSANLIIF